MISHEALVDALSNKRFELILMPTEKCNFRCTYCYEDFAIGRMKRPVIEGVKNFISNRVTDLTMFSISWFGGEPLLAKQVILEIGAHAYGECKAKGIHFGAGFTTNGWALDKDTCEAFSKINHRHYQISLDGDEEWHNKTRILANKHPTFGTIYGNLQSIKELSCEFHVTLRLHVHGQNIESQKRLYSRLKDDLLFDKRFSVYFHKVSNLSSNGIIKERILSNPEYKEAIEYISGEPSALKEKQQAEIYLSDYICYAAKPNSFIIRADGRLAKCTVALADPRNDVGRIREDGTLDIKNDKLRRWFEGYRDMSERILGCPVHGL